MIRTYHPTFQATRVITGRLSTTGLPVLGMPKDSPIGRQIRDAVRAPRGSVIARVDYSQIELRFGAHLSQDPGLIDGFRRGDDIHAMVAHRVLGAPPSREDQDEAQHRKPSKIANFSIWMGTTLKGFTEQVHKAGNLKWSAQCPGCQSHRAIHLQRVCDSTRFFAEYFQQFPRIRAYQAERIERCRQTGYAEGLWGERWYLPGIWSPHERVAEAAERQSFALPVQSANARLIKQAMGAIRANGLAPCPGARLILQVHDELVFIVQETLVETWLPTVVATMEGVARISVPIVAEGSWGPTWLDQRKLEA